MSQGADEQQRMLGPRTDLDPRNLELLGGAEDAPSNLRAMFASQHPVLYLTSLAVCVACGLLLASVFAGVLGHVVMNLVLWAWRLVP